MRRFPLVVLLSVALLAGGCIPLPAVPTVAPPVSPIEVPTAMPTAVSAAVPTAVTTTVTTTVPTAVLTAVLTDVPTAVAAATQAPAATLPAAATVPAATAPAAIETPAVAPASTLGNAAQPPTPAPANPNVATFTDPALRISFNYLRQDNGTQFDVKQAGDKVYLYMTTLPPEQGQWLQVYQKPPDQTLEDAIRQQVLKGYSAQDCLVVKAQDPNTGSPTPPGQVFASIDLPRSADDTMEALQAKAAKCPQPYAAIGGLAYFMEDTAHPDRFVFFSIGQYYVPGGNGQPWQTTVRILAPDSIYFMDDRSGPVEVLQSFFNALNLKQYVRAYSYWIGPAGSPGGPPPFNQFQAGYSKTESVQLFTGQVLGDVGAGQLYYSVPVVLIAQVTGGAVQTFSGCYILHLSRPEIQDAPPFNPLGIESAAVVARPNGSNIQKLLASACAGSPGGQPVPPTPTYDPAYIGPDRYLDNRSGPVELLRSLFNAINSKQYDRAFSYWSSPAGSPGGPPPYAQFKQGYQDTASVQLKTGTVAPGAAAGNLYYSVPVTLIAKTTANATQTFVGCYVLHLAQPNIQGAPPFQALGIQSGRVQQVPNNADTASLMAMVCQ